MVSYELTLEEQMEYAKSPYWQDRISFATTPVLPEVADFMIENEKNPGVLSIICERLFRKSDSNIWSSTLEKAARKKVKLRGVNPEFDHALTNIALHLNTNVDTLTYLFNLNDQNINWGLANNPNTPKVLLDKLADIKNFDIDDALLYNPNTSKETRTMLEKRYPSGIISCGYYYDFNGVKVKASGN